MALGAVLVISKCAACVGRSTPRPRSPQLQEGLPGRASTTPHHISNPVAMQPAAERALASSRAAPQARERIHSSRPRLEALVSCGSGAVMLPVRFSPSVSAPALRELAEAHTVEVVLSRDLRASPEAATSLIERNAIAAA